MKHLLIFLGLVVFSNLALGADSEVVEAMKSENRMAAKCPYCGEHTIASLIYEPYTIRGCKHSQQSSIQVYIEFKKTEEEKLQERIRAIEDENRRLKESLSRFMDIGKMGEGR